MVLTVDFCGNTNLKLTLFNLGYLQEIATIVVSWIKVEVLAISAETLRLGKINYLIYE
jgi:hypothetical protein